jgi:hypothetical protein
MHSAAVNTDMVSAVANWLCYRREAAATQTADLWNEFSSGNTSRVADFSFAGFNYGQDDPPVANEADWQVINVACPTNVSNDGKRLNTPALHSLIQPLELMLANAGSLLYYFRTLSVRQSDFFGEEKQMRN